MTNSPDLILFQMQNVSAYVSIMFQHIKTKQNLKHLNYLFGN